MFRKKRRIKELISEVVVLQKQLQESIDRSHQIIEKRNKREQERENQYIKLGFIPKEYLIDINEDPLLAGPLQDAFNPYPYWVIDHKKVERAVEDLDAYNAHQRGSEIAGRIGTEGEDDAPRE